MLGKTLPEYIFILFSIAILNLIAPASLLYIAYYIYDYLYSNHAGNKVYAVLSTGILGYAILEVLFLFGVYWPRKRRLVKVCSHVAAAEFPSLSNTCNVVRIQEALFDAPEQLTQTEREVLFTKCASVVFPPYGSYPLGWFTLPKQDSGRLRKENVVEWLLWALFACEVESALLDEWKEEIEGYVRRIEERLGYKLEDGHDKSARSMRLTFDELKANYRPLIWYIIVGIVDFISGCRLFFLGFKHHTPKHNNFLFNLFSVFPFRPLDIFSRSSSTPYFPYWHRPHKSATKDPIVFIHGIGIGIYPYIPLIATLAHEDPDVGILLVELLPISNRILMPYVGLTSKIFPIPTRRTMLDALYTTMHSLGAPWSKAVLMTHSYGTVIAAYDVRGRAQVERDAPYHDDDGITTPAPIPQFTAYLLIDPIPFLLNLPPVAYNFMYRAPWRSRSDDSPHSPSSSSLTTTRSPLWKRIWTGYNGNEWQLWYFASRDLEVGYTLSRRFFWDDVVLWKEDVGLEDATTNTKNSANDVGIRSSGSSPPMAVVLSGDDQILPASTIRDYLIGGDTDQGKWAQYEMGCYTHYTSSLSASVAASSGSPIIQEVLFYPGLDHATVFDTRRRRQGLVEVLDRFSSSRAATA
ncbi:hypothetical protein V5O48_009057 [Marasmius crinis-equi]|uniref:AB hydrolase-1 domain-containing protein n=1 Tax=Marasmius crinis-equi TaxID=585013 RepID=A0ABR3FC72_9AGAR